MGAQEEAVCLQRHRTHFDHPISWTCLNTASLFSFMLSGHRPERPVLFGCKLKQGVSALQDHIKDMVLMYNPDLLND